MCMPVCRALGEYFKKFGCEGGEGTGYIVFILCPCCNNVSSTAYELVLCDRLVIKLVCYMAEGNPQLLIITHMTHT